MDITKVNDTKINEAQISQNQESQKASQLKKVNVGTTQSAAASSKAAKYLDKIDFSGDAAVAAEGIEAAKTSPDVRAEKVAHLKAAIKNGTYNPDAKNIADSMIQKSLEDSLLTRKG
jgi:flagellar biosynthesis anti-sigma factor FlgM